VLGRVTPARPEDDVVDWSVSTRAVELTTED